MEEIANAAGWSIEEMTAALEDLSWSSPPSLCPPPQQYTNNVGGRDKTINFCADIDIDLCTHEQNRNHEVDQVQKFYSSERLLNSAFLAHGATSKVHVRNQENLTPNIPISVGKQSSPPLFDVFVPSIEKCREVKALKCTSRCSPDVKIVADASTPIEETLPFLDEPMSNGFKLFKHQKEAVVQALRLQRVILAYDMGLGKTCISLVWALEMYRRLHQSCTLIIVSPCTLVDNWKREATMLGLVHVDPLSTSFRRNQSRELTFAIYSWAKIPDPDHIANCCRNKMDVRDFLVICDEAHAMQNMKSQRTQLALKLALHSACRGQNVFQPDRMFETIQNRCVE